MSGDIKLLVESINNLWNANNRTIFSVIVNLTYTLFTLLLLVVGWRTLKTTKDISKSSESLSKDLRKQDLEQRVLREDIFVTVIPIFSSDWFSKIKHKKASWNSGLLKVMKHSSGMWEYLIIDPAHYINWNTWEKVWSEERELEYSTRDTDFKWWFHTKYSCIEYAMTYHNLKSSYIEFTNKDLFNSVHFTE
jgi:hypothetical protein